MFDFPASPSVGQQFTPAGGPTWQWNGTVWLMAAAPGVVVLQQPYNWLINGELDVFQRGNQALPINLGANFVGYTLDRWYAACQTGMSLSMTRGAVSPGSWGGAIYYGDWSFTGTGAAGSYVSQKIEGVRNLAGKSITVSGWMGLLAAGNINVQPVQRFGTGGSPSGSVVVTSQNVAVPGGGLTTPFSLKFDIPAITGKTLGSNNDDYLEIQFGITNPNAQRLFMTHMSVTEGDMRGLADPFTRRSPQQELALCQRYYYGSYTVGAANTFVNTLWSGNAVNAVTYFAYAYLPTPMRVAAPSIIAANLSASQFPAAVGTLAGITPNIIRESRVANATGNGALFVSGLYLDAEL